MKQTKKNGRLDPGHV